MVVTYLSYGDDTICMSLRTIINSFLDKLHEATEYCNQQEMKYRNLREEEEIIMHVKYDKNPSVITVKKVLQSVVAMLLCPYTWVGATAAFMFELPDVATAGNAYMTFSLMIWSFSVSLWLAMNIYNVRGKPIPIQG